MDKRQRIEFEFEFETKEKRAIRESIETLELLANKADSANPFSAVDIVKKMVREQMRFNHLISEYIL